MAWGLSRISSRELTEWQAYYNLEPWGEERADLRSAIVASTVANTGLIFVDRKHRRRQYKVDDFMPDFGAREDGGGEVLVAMDPEIDKAEENWRRQLALVEQLNVAFGGKDLRVKH